MRKPAPFPVGPGNLMSLPGVDSAGKQHSFGAPLAKRSCCNTCRHCHVATLPAQGVLLPLLLALLLGCHWRCHVATILLPCYCHVAAMPWPQSLRRLTLDFERLKAAQLTSLLSGWRAKGDRLSRCAPGRPMSPPPNRTRAGRAGVERDILIAPEASGTRMPVCVGVRPCMLTKCLTCADFGSDRLVDDLKQATS